MNEETKESRPLKHEDEYLLRRRKDMSDGVI